MNPQDGLSGNYCHQGMTCFTVILTAVFMQYVLAQEFLS